MNKENSLISKSFLWMAIGLLVTFATGFMVSQSNTMLDNVFGSMYWVFIIAELILVLVLSAMVMKMSPVVAKVCFILYSFVSGLTFASIFVVYSMSSIMTIFLIAAVLFGVMSLIGYKTNMDLTKIGTYCLIGLVAVIIASLINIFIGNTMVEIVISAITIILFIGITAYDVKKIKALQGSGLPEDNLAVYGALELYLDFINIFLDLLRLFGKSDN